jgi:hypothetical protein
LNIAHRWSDAFAELNAACPEPNKILERSMLYF